MIDSMLVFLIIKQRLVLMLPVRLVVSERFIDAYPEPPTPKRNGIRLL